MRIAVTGANGMIGSSLVKHFAQQGHELTLLVRREFPSSHKLSLWNPFTGKIAKGDLEGVNIVVHLAGKNLSAGRWTRKLKKELRESRTLSTTLLAQTLARLERKPKLFLSGSAVGFYGSSLEANFDESSPAGRGFLADLCVEWEECTQAAEAAGIRTVKMRFGVVLSTEGGMLAKVLPLFKLGLGGKIGSGKQMMSWIAAREIGEILDFILAQPQLAGPINFTTPNPVTNAQFTRALGKHLKRPALFRVPHLALKLVFGEMAEETALSSTTAIPRKLLDAGYQFHYPEINAALAALFAR